MTRKLLNNRYFDLTSKTVFVFIFAVLSILHVHAQTCTLSGTGTINWSNASPPACQEGGNAGAASILVIPAGVTLDFNSNGDTWTGTRIDVFGSLDITHNGQITINSSIQIKSTGDLFVQSKLSLGSASGCGYNVVIESGGNANLQGGADDRLSICGNTIVQGGGACNPYPDGPTPYCETGSGIPGPVGFTQSGISGPLPVTWLYFNAKPLKESIELTWATTMEKNTAWFVIERSVDGSLFQQIGQVDAIGESQKKQTYAFIDANPIVGRSFYRLKEVDFDGYTEYFPKTVSVLFDGNRRVIVSPNPSEQGAPLSIGINFAPEESSYFIITDMTGLEVFQGTFTGIVLNQNISLNSGSYILKLRTGNNSYMTRFVIR